MCSLDDLEFYEKNLIKKYDSIGQSYNMAAATKHGMGHPILKERAIQDDFRKSIKILFPEEPKILIGINKICKIFNMSEYQLKWWMKQPGFPVKKITNAMMGHYDDIKNYLYTFEISI